MFDIDLDDVLVAIIGSLGINVPRRFFDLLPYHILEACIVTGMY